MLQKLFSVCLVFINFNSFIFDGFNLRSFSLICLLTRGTHGVHISTKKGSVLSAVAPESFFEVRSDHDSNVHDPVPLELNTISHFSV